ncbi:MAG: copper chaperone PCu(A)C [Pseudomonadota bacterium]
MNLLKTLTAAIIAVYLPILPAAAHEMTKGAITADHPILKLNIGDRPSAGYMTIENKGAADRIVAARSPAFERVELHTHSMVDGLMQMREVEAIDVPASGSVALKPGGLHLMLFTPTRDLSSEALLPVTVVFESAGEMELTLMVEKIGHGAKKSGGHEHGSHSHDGATQKTE